MLSGQRVRCPGARDVDGRTVDEQRSGLRRGDHVLPYRNDVLARRQHGDDDVCVLDALSGVPDNLNAIGGGRLARCRDNVKTEYRAAAFDQIGGHWPAHVSKTDKSDIRHETLFQSENVSSSAPADLKCRSTMSGVTAAIRSGSHFGLRSLSTIVARMPSMKSCPAMLASAIR